MLGKDSEEKVLELYLSQGYTLIAQNYRVYSHGRGQKAEIDSIVTKENILVCIEVKNRNTNFAPIAESITPKKIQLLQFAMKFFLAEHPQYQKKFVRFDAAFVTHGKIEIIQNIV